MIPAHAQRRNAVSLYYQAYDEFSFSPRISQTLNPDIADINYSKRGIATKKSLYAPYTLGIAFQRAYSSASSWRLSALVYNSVPRSNDINGESFDKTHFTVYGGYSRILRSSVSERLRLSGSIDGVLRGGTDTYWVDYGNNWVDIYPARTLADIGVRVGLNGTWFLGEHIFTSLEVDYTRWAFLYSNVFDRKDIGSGLYPLKPGNQLEFNLSLGFMFGTEQSQVPKKVGTDSASTGSHRHTIRVSLGAPYFIDHQHRAFTKDIGENIRQPVASIRYHLQLKDRWGLCTRFGYQRMVYTDLDRGLRSQASLGTIMSRDMGVFEVGATYTVVQKWVSVDIGGGVAYRHGNQYFITSNEFETNAAHQMRDIGPSLSIQASRSLSKHISVFLTTHYNYFVYRKEDGLDRYPFDRGPSKQVIALDAGFGYKF